MSPDPGAQPVTQASGRTLIDYLKEYLARPDVVERMKPWQTACDGLLKAFSGLCEQTVAVIQRAAESPPSVGYEPFLVERSFDPIWARMMARLLVRSGKRCANESVRLPAVVGAIRFLAKPGRGRRPILRKAEVLLAAWEETSIIETIFDDASLNMESEFIGLLKSAVEGHEVSWRRITEIAAAVAPHLSIPRGPKVSAASAAHEFFLESVVGPIEPRAYTWNEIVGKCTDPATEATRREFANSNFDPRPAYRRLKSRRIVKIS
jgi:hypothetical protein